MDQKSGKPSQKRRAILQGSLAAPLVLTASSASAQMVSSHMKCAGKIAQPTQWLGLFFLTPTQYADPQDTWLRESIKVRQFQDPSRNPSDNTKIGWFFYDQYDPHPNQKWINVETLTKLDPGWKETGAVDQDRWALVWVDSSSGRKIRVSLQKPATSQFTTESCYASVIPTTTP